MALVVSLELRVSAWAGGEADFNLIAMSGEETGQRIRGGNAKTVPMTTGSDDNDTERALR